MKYQIPPRAAAMTAMPPTTPPAMAPVGVDLGLELAEELADEVLFVVADASVAVSVDPRVLLVEAEVVIVRANIVSRFVLLNPPDGAVAVAPPDPLQRVLLAFPTLPSSGPTRKENKCDLLPTNNIINRFWNFICIQV
jgi:hypothetical protein